MKFFLPFFSILFIVLSLVACEKPNTSAIAPPKQFLSEKQMLDILTDVQIANTAVERKAGGNPDLKQKQRQEYLNAIFQKNKVEASVFWENYNYYATQPELLDTIYAQMKPIFEKQIPIEEERMRKNPPPAPLIVPTTPKPLTSPKGLIGSGKGGSVVK